MNKRISLLKSTLAAAALISLTGLPSLAAQIEEDGAFPPRIVSGEARPAAAAASISHTAAPSIPAGPERLFLAYACGTTLCSNEIEVVPATGFARGRTIGRTVKTNRYTSKASIDFKMLDGKRAAVVSWSTKPVSGKPTSKRWTYEFSKYDVSTSIWFDTGTDQEHDLLVIRGTELLADLPLPLGRIKGNGLAKFSRESSPQKQRSARIANNYLDMDGLEYPPKGPQSAPRYASLR